MKTKFACDKCGKKVRTRHMAIFWGEILCSNCKPNRIFCGVSGKLREKYLKIKRLYLPINHKTY